MHMMHMRAEFADEAHLVDHLPDKMRRIVIHSNGAIPGFENAPPDMRGIGDIVSARPFIIAENHRAILESELDSVVARMSDDVRPDLERFFPVVIDMFGG